MSRLKKRSAYTHCGGVRRSVKAAGRASRWVRRRRAGDGDGESGDSMGGVVGSAAPEVVGCC